MTVKHDPSLLNCPCDKCWEKPYVFKEKPMALKNPGWNVLIFNKEPTVDPPEGK